MRGELLWTPPADRVERSQLTAYLRERGFATYDELWRWSVEDLEGFWASIWERYDVGGVVDRVLGGRAAVRRRLDALGGDTGVEDFRVEQVVWGGLGLLGAALLGTSYAFVWWSRHPSSGSGMPHSRSRV